MSTFLFCFLKEGDQRDHNLFDAPSFQKHSAAKLILSNRHFGNHFQSVSSSSPLLILQMTNCKKQQQRQRQQWSRVTVLHTSHISHSHFRSASLRLSDLGSFFALCFVFTSRGRGRRRCSPPCFQSFFFCCCCFLPPTKLVAPPAASQAHDGRRTENIK